MIQPIQSPSPEFTAVFIAFIVFSSSFFPAHPDNDILQGTHRQKDLQSGAKDTTALLTAGPWLHKKREKKEYDSTFVRKFYFMKGGHFKIEITGSQLQKTDLGTWYREGKSIITDLYSAPGEHQWRIISLEKDTLLLYFVDRNVTDLLVKP